MRYIKLNETVLYRAKTDKSRYPGKFWSEIESVARHYSKKSKTGIPRSIETQTFEISPDHVLDVSNMPLDKKNRLKIKFQKWFEENYPDREIDDVRGPYLYDVLFQDQTDFVYPTEVDVEFLRNEGYRAVYFEYEGGEKVKTWWIF